MPIKSSYPDLELQDKDIFSFLFKRQDRPFPDHKGMTSQDVRENESTWLLPLFPFT